jgi:hypothetical protein
MNLERVIGVATKQDKDHEEGKKYGVPALAGMGAKPAKAGTPNPSHPLCSLRSFAANDDG